MAACSSKDLPRETRVIDGARQRHRAHQCGKRPDRGAQPRLLSRLRKWLPAGMVDNALRKTFTLDA